MDIEKYILKHTGASSIRSYQKVQSLWSNYGELNRYFLEGSSFKSVIVKHIKLPRIENHPKGWNTSISHERKLKSYRVEANWYKYYAADISASSAIPKAIFIKEIEDEFLFIMEDLNESGFVFRASPDQVKMKQVKNCLTWLANFHAQNMNVQAEGLWEVGTYWHLATRPDEFEQMNNLTLKKVAGAIDKALNLSTYQTLVHGDAKLANFCFDSNDNVAAVDFQYVGMGCGMKDVAYFLSSCFEEEECEKYADNLLSYYFDELQLALHPSIDFNALRPEWQLMYALAWADFYRFLDGWRPGHWKMHAYSKRLTKKAITYLDNVIDC